MGRNSVDGVDTRYGLGGLAIESRCGVKILRTHPDWPWGSPSLVYSGYWVSFLGVKRPGRGVDHPMVGSRLKSRAKLYSPSGFSWSVLG